MLYSEYFNFYIAIINVSDAGEECEVMFMECEEFADCLGDDRIMRILFATDDREKYLDVIKNSDLLLTKKDKKTTKSDFIALSQGNEFFLSYPPKAWESLKERFKVVGECNYGYIYKHRRLF